MATKKFSLSAGISSQEFGLVVKARASWPLTLEVEEVIKRFCRIVLEEEQQVGDVGLALLLDESLLLPPTVSSHDLDADTCGDLEVVLNLH